MRRRYMRPQSRLVRVAGTELHLLDEGPPDAPVVLALPAQWMCFTQYDAWAPALTDRYRVLRLDLPGHGLSGPAVDRDYSIGGFERLVVGLLDRLGIARCALVGPSYGGIVAFRLAAHWPERVGALVLANSSGLPRSRSAPKQPNLPPPNPWLAWLELYFRPRAYFRWKLAEMMPGMTIPAELVDEVTRLNNIRGRIEEGRLRVAAYDVGDPQAVLADVRAPTLIQQSDRSTYLPVENADLFERWLTDAPTRKIIYEGAGHLLIGQLPERTGRDVRRFLDDRYEDRRR